MPPLICIFSTETNGLHNSKEFVSKKNMFEFARPLKINYIIGYRENNKFTKIKQEKFIFKPEYLTISPSITKINNLDCKICEKKGKPPLEILTTFKNDLKNVRVLVSHNISFHIKSLQVECFRQCVDIEFSNYILIDTINFGHKFEYPKLKELSKTLLDKDYEEKSSDYNIIIIKKCFLKLYDNYEKQIINT